MSEAKKMGLFTLTLFGILIVVALFSIVIPWSIWIMKIVFYILSVVFAVFFLICLALSFIHIYAKIVGKTFTEVTDVINNFFDC